MPFKKHVQRIATIFTDAQFDKIEKFCKDNKISKYAMAKQAIIEYLAKRGVKLPEKD